tara:strand:- start:699 stop:1310 length:612 start_codon:yes stop_codon:yes gene_type:complete
MAKVLSLENKLASDKKPVKIGEDSTGLLLADNDVFVENTPTKDYHVATKKYIDDQISQNANMNFYIRSAFYHGGTNLEYIPLAGGSISEQASLVDHAVDDSFFVVPFDLKITKIYANITKPSSGSNNAGNTAMRLLKGGTNLSGSITVDLSSVGYDSTNIQDVYTWDFSGETNTYSAGEVMQISIDPTSNLYYVSLTIVGEYT